MAGAPATGTMFDWAYFAPERPAFRAIASWSNEALTACLIVAAALVLIAALTLKPLEKAVLFAWLVLP